jgi:hypothetical protein
VTRALKLGTTGVALAVLVAVAGCTSTPNAGSQTADTSRTFSVVIAAAIDRAGKDVRVDDSQVAVLVNAQSAGTLTADAARGALASELTCLEDAAFTGGRVVDDESMGFPSPGIVDLAPPPNVSNAQANGLLDDCDAKYATYVLYAYAQQPASQDAYWALADAAAPDIRRCLEDSGVPASAIGASTAEVVETAVAFFMELDDELTQYGSENCLGDLPVPTANR